MHSNSAYTAREWSHPLQGNIYDTALLATSLHSL